MFSCVGVQVWSPARDLHPAPSALQADVPLPELTGDSVAKVGIDPTGATRLQRALGAIPFCRGTPSRIRTDDLRGENPAS